MQVESAAVVTAALIKATAQEVSASRHRYQTTSAAAEQLRRHRGDSIESKTLEANKTQQVCFPVSLLLPEPANIQLFIVQRRVCCG